MREDIRRNRGEGVVRVFIAESVPVFRQGLEAGLAAGADMRVAGSASTEAELRMHLETGAYDVMLLDSALPGLEGFAILKQFKERFPDQPVLLMTASQDVGRLLRGIRAGAAGALAKESTLEEFRAAIRRVHAGHRYIAEPLADRLLLFYQRNENEPLEDRLSPREFEVMQGLASGLKLSEIARKLKVSHQTVTTHRRHILEKTGLRTTAEIIRYGILHGMGDPLDRSGEAYAPGRWDGPVPRI